MPNSQERADPETLRAFAFILLGIVVVGLVLYFVTSAPSTKTKLDGIPAVETPSRPLGEGTGN